jgi:hypothetical protein
VHFKDERDPALDTLEADVEKVFLKLRSERAELEGLSQFPSITFSPLSLLSVSHTMRFHDVDPFELLRQRKKRLTFAPEASKKEEDVYINPLYQQHIDPEASRPAGWSLSRRDAYVVLEERGWCGCCSKPVYATWSCR